VEVPEENSSQKIQLSLTDKDLQNIKTMAAAHAKKEESIALSGARTKSQNEFLQGLRLSIDGAVWSSKPHDHDLVDSI
jgi:hypothetical protein